MRILITGSAGFIGGSVGRVAAAAGHTVVGLARRSQSESGWPGEHVAVDVATADLVPALSAVNPDVILHAAGAASVGSSVTAPLDDFRAAVVSWVNLLDAVRRSGRRPVVVFPSSAAVYGNPASLPVAEGSSIDPISPYGYHKAACELLAREYARCFGLTVVVIRVFSVFGPAQRRLLVWDLFQQAAGPSPELWLDGTGLESRDYLDVEDLSDLILQLAAARRGGAAGVTTVNAGSGEETSVLTVAELIRSAAGADAKPIRCRGHARPGDPCRWRADVQHLVELAGGWTRRPLAEGIARCVAEWRRKTTKPDGLR